MRKFTIFLIIFLVFMALAFLLPKYYHVPYPIPLGPPLASRPRQTYRFNIDVYKPNIVLLGDSLLDYGVNDIVLADHVDRTVYKIAIHGSASAAWYLIIRHNIVPAETPPRVLMIFFRDSILTVPDYRVQGRHYDNIVFENTAPDDSLFIQYSFIDLMSPVEKVAEQYLPLYGQRENVREEIDFTLRYNLPGMMMSCDYDCTNLAIEEVFNTDNLEPGITASEMYLYTQENLDFHARLDHSYLPEMIRLTRARGIQLVLVRMKTLFVPHQATQRQALQIYMDDLVDYLNANDVPLLDYSDDPRITPDHFYDTFHLSDTGQEVLTEILSEDLNLLLDELP